jgi:hypothetical protein
MEDQEREPLTDENEDVEGHGNYGAPAKGAPAKGRDESDDDDVEAHSNFGAPAKGAPAKG